MDIDPLPSPRPRDRDPTEGAVEPEDLTVWFPAFRDFVIVIVSAFILIFEATLTSNPNPYLVGAALTLLGAPAALQIDAVRRKNGNGGNGHGPGEKS